MRTVAKHNVDTEVDTVLEWILLTAVRLNAESYSNAFLNEVRSLNDYVRQISMAVAAYVCSRVYRFIFAVNVDAKPMQPAKTHKGLLTMPVQVTNR